MYKVYVVEQGETISSIANKFRITTQELRQINGFPESYEPEFSQTIIVPVSKNNMFTNYTVKQGETLYGIANGLGINYKDLAALNGLDENEYIYPNQQIKIPNNNVAFYISKENETLGTIANKLMITQEKLISENANIYVYPDQLFVHQKE